MFVDPATGRNESAALLLGGVQDVLSKVGKGVLLPEPEHVLEAQVHGRGVGPGQHLVFIGRHQPGN